MNDYFYFLAFKCHSNFPFCIDGQACFVRLQRITSVCFFVNKWIYDKLLFAWWANSKRIRGNFPGFCFTFSIRNRFRYTVYIYICTHTYYMHLNINLYIRKTETANFRLFSANGKWKFVFLGRQTTNGNRCLLCQQTFPPTHFRKAGIRKNYFHLFDTVPVSDIIMVLNSPTYQSRNNYYWILRCFVLGRYQIIKAGHRHQGN